MSKQILIKPVISEKSELLTEEKGKYSFVVSKDVNKIEIRSAIEKKYNVNVKSVNTLIMPSKTKRRQTRSGMIEGKKSSFKKAVITIAEGEEIDFFGDF